MPVISGICFGSAGVFVRELSENMNSISIISSRMFIAILLLGLWLAVCHPMYFKIKLKDIWIFIGAGVIGTLALAGCVLTSGIFENNTSMHWTWIGILVGSAGAVFYALYSIFSKVGMKKGYSALTITFYSMMTIAIILFPFTQWGHIIQYIVVKPIRNTLFMMLHSLCTAVCPYAFYTVALDHMEAGKASILCSCEPVAAMLFGLFFFGEIPTALSIIGLVVVLVALAMLVLSDKKQESLE